MRIMSELPGLGGDKPVHRIGGSDLCDLFGITPGMLTTLGKRDIVVRLGRDAYDPEESTRCYIASLRERARKTPKATTLGPTKRLSGSRNTTQRAARPG